MQNPSVIYHYPYIISFSMVIFILPQIIVVFEKSILPIDSTNRLFFMTLLCWAMSFVGWYTYKPRSAVFDRTFVKLNLDEAKLGLVGKGFICVGIFFNIISYRLLAQNDFGGQATGIVTIYLFFQQLLALGTGICLSLWLKNKDKVTLAFVIIGVLYGFYIGVLLGRRIETVTTLIFLGLPYFIHNKIKPPRTIIIGFLLLIFLVMPSIGQYRQILKTSKDVSEFFPRLFSELDIQKNLNDFYVNAKTYELVNGGYQIDYTYRSSDYSMGFGYWNEIIFRFVPAQIVGKELKQSLMINFDLFSEQRRDINAANPNYVVGSTATGIADAFHQFDYFGCIFFFVVGRFMRRLWFTIAETKTHLLIVLYASLLIASILSITHTTTGFLPAFLSAFIFLNLAGWYSKT